jgi:lipopolysaccharide/colanic/teichoic acid biosynthesis glycosyltransferase
MSERVPVKVKLPSLKRCLDVAVALPALILSSPVQLAAAVAVRVTMGNPVLFRQRRPGLHGEPFELRKFRSMREEDPSRQDSSDASRMTPVGNFLRSTSIDELPSLWNVVRGDMSLVGPRPLRMEYLEHYSARQARRHEVKPGLTGLAQVSGRNGLTWEERFELDVEYVENRSLRLDLQILLRTVAVVLRREGISEEGGPTMSRFQGTSAAEAAAAVDADEPARA